MGRGCGPQSVPWLLYRPATPRRKVCMDPTERRAGRQKQLTEVETSARAVVCSLDWPAWGKGGRGVCKSVRASGMCYCDGEREVAGSSLPLV